MRSQSLVSCASSSSLCPSGHLRRDCTISFVLGLLYHLVHHQSNVAQLVDNGIYEKGYFTQATVSGEILKESNIEKEHRDQLRADRAEDGDKFDRNCFEDTYEANHLGYSGKMECVLPVIKMAATKIASGLWTLCMLPPFGGGTIPSANADDPEGGNYTRQEEDYHSTHGEQHQRDQQQWQQQQEQEQAFANGPPPNAPAAGVSDNEFRDIKYSLPQVHCDAEHYADWRHGMMTTFLTLLPERMQGIGFQYWREIDVYVDAWYNEMPTATKEYYWTALRSTVPTDLSRMDPKLYQVLSNYAAKSSGGIVLGQKIRDDAAYGSGRQAMAVMDKYYNFQRSLLAQKAQTAILAMNVERIQDLDAYVTSFKRHMSHMVQGGETMGDSFLLNPLKKQTRKVNELAATMAQFQVRPPMDRTTGSLLDSFEKLIAERRADGLDQPGKSAAALKGKKGKGKDGKGAGRGAGAQQNYLRTDGGGGAGGGGKKGDKGKDKGKKGDPKGKGKGGDRKCYICDGTNHLAWECFFNPAGPNYRPDLVLQRQQGKGAGKGAKAAAALMAPPVPVWDHAANQWTLPGQPPPTPYVTLANVPPPGLQYMQPQSTPRLSTVPSSYAPSSVSSSPGGPASAYAAVYRPQQPQQQQTQMVPVDQAYAMWQQRRRGYNAVCRAVKKEEGPKESSGSDTEGPPKLVSDSSDADSKKEDGAKEDEDDGSSSDEEDEVFLLPAPKARSKPKPKPKPVATPTPVAKAAAKVPTHEEPKLAAMRKKQKQARRRQQRETSAGGGGADPDAGEPAEEGGEEFIVDTGASFHVVNCDNVPAAAQQPTQAVQFETAAGPRTLSTSTRVRLPGTTETVEAMCSSESPNLCSVGSLVSSGWEFTWSGSGAQLTSPGGHVIPLRTESGVPMLSAAVMRQVQRYQDPGTPTPPTSATVTTPGSSSTYNQATDAERAAFFEWLGAQGPNSAMPTANTTIFHAPPQPFECPEAGVEVIEAVGEQAQCYYPGCPAWATHVCNCGRMPCERHQRLYDMRCSACCAAEEGQAPEEVPHLCGHCGWWLDVPDRMIQHCG